MGHRPILFEEWFSWFYVLIASGSCYVAQAGFEPTMLLPWPPESWDYRDMSSLQRLDFSFPFELVCRAALDS